LTLLLRIDKREVGGVGKEKETETEKDRQREGDVCCVCECVCERERERKRERERERDLFGREVLDILGGFDGLVYHSKSLVKLFEIAIHNGRVLCRLGLN
jgi:hypothetical protein